MKRPLPITLLQNALLGSFIAGMLIMFVVALSGCQAPNHPAPTTQQVADELSLDVADAVGASIVISPRPAERARRIVEVATQIKHVAESGVDLTDLRRLATEIVLKAVDEDERAAARFAANLIFNRAKRRLGLNLDVTVIPADRLPRLRALIITACSSAIESAGQYTEQ